jgi:hypothetical protein
MSEKDSLQKQHENFDLKTEGDLNRLQKSLVRNKTTIVLLRQVLSEFKELVFIIAFIAFLIKEFVTIFLKTF